MPPRNGRGEGIVSTPAGYYRGLTDDYSAITTNASATAGLTGTITVGNPLSSHNTRPSSFAELIQRDTERTLQRAYSAWEVEELAEAVETLIEELGMSDEQVNSLFTSWERDGYSPPTLTTNNADSMANKITRYLRGDKVEGIDDDVVKGYYDNEKKKRYLNRDERSILHKPCKDGDKPTSSIKLDDLVPAD